MAVDVDAALRKPRYQRTPDEQRAVDDYITLLFPHEKVDPSQAKPIGNAITQRSQQQGAQQQQQQPEAQQGAQPGAEAAAATAQDEYGEIRGRIGGMRAAAASMEEGEAKAAAAKAAAEAAAALNEHVAREGSAAQIWDQLVWYAGGDEGKAASAISMQAEEIKEGIAKAKKQKPPKGLVGITAKADWASEQSDAIASMERELARWEAAAQEPARRRAEIRNYIANRRIAQAKEIAQGYREQELAAREQYAQEAFHLSYDEYVAREEVAAAEMEEAAKNFDIQEFNAILAEEYEQRLSQQQNDTTATTSNDTPAESPGDGSSDSVLPGQQPVPAPRAGSAEEQSQASAAAGVQGPGPSGDVPQSPSQPGQVAAAASSPQGAQGVGEAASSSSQEATAQPASDFGPIGTKSSADAQAIGEPVDWSKSTDIQAMRDRLDQINRLLDPDSEASRQLFADYEKAKAEGRALVDKYGSQDNIPSELLKPLLAAVEKGRNLISSLHQEAADINQRLLALDAEEKARQKTDAAAAAAEADATDFSGFLAGKAKLARATARRALEKRIKVDGKTATVAEHVERMVAAGDIRLATSTEPAYKGVSNRRYNQMTDEEQAAHDKRIAESKKTVYLVNGYNLGKTAYDYAAHLAAQSRAAGAAATNSRDGGEGGIRQERGRAGGKVSGRERRLRDGLVGVLREAGIEVVMDAEEGQRVLDEYNRRREARKKALETVLPGEYSPFKGTVVSSADGAKVLNNLEKLAADYQETPSKKDTRGFLGKVAQALCATKHGSNSQYATFETKSGAVVTIRLANHNAKVSTFDNHGEADGISIVISRKPKQGITNDGTAHVVEFFYPDRALAKAEGNPLPGIVRSIQQSLYSGEFKDTTGLAERNEVNPSDIREQRVWHGSGADFDAFDHSHMGEGDGNQSHGWGFYAVKERGKASVYANGHLYEVEIPDDTGRNYLDYDREVDAGERRRIFNELYRVLAADEYKGSESELRRELDELVAISQNGGDIYGNVSAYLGGDKEASEFLHGLGYVGISYEDKGSHNYVVFNEKDAKITDHIRFFRTPDGTAYGFTTADGRIYIDPRVATAETPLHEYTHLWTTMLRQSDPRAWRQVVELLKGTEAWREAEARYPELLGDEDALADEALAMYAGARGAERLRQQQEAGMSEEDIFARAARVAAVERVKAALRRLWRWVGRLLGRPRWRSLEEVGDAIMSDVMERVSPLGKANAKQKRGGVKTDEQKDKGGAGSLTGGQGLRLSEDEEVRDIVARAKADGSYMTAPNGQPSRLTPRQWAQVRTAAFKRWFGDWETAARAAAVKALKAIRIEEHTMDKEQLRNVYSSLKPIVKDGASVELYNSAFKKNYREGGLFAKIIPQLRDIFEKAVFAYSEDDRLAGTQRPDGSTHKAHKNVVGWRNYVGKVEIGGKEYYVRFTVQEEKSGKQGAHSFFVSSVDIYENPTESRTIPITSRGTTDSDGIVDAKLRDFFDTANNSSKVLDENGEPVVLQPNFHKKVIDKLVYVNFYY